MRIVYSIPTRIGAGGLGTDSFEAVRAIYEAGYLAKVVAYGNSQKTVPASYIRSIRVHPVKVFSNLPARYYYPIKRKALDRVARGVLARSADIFHGWSSASLESLRLCRERGIISFLENPGPHYLYAERVIGQEYRDLGIPRVNLPTLFPRFFGQDQAYHLSEYEAARYILLESPFTLETFLLHGIPRERLTFLPRGVDTERFVPPRERSDSTFRALFVGALCVRKGVHRLLDAWTGLRLRNAELLLVGTLRDEVRTLVTSYTERDPSIRIAGFVSNPVNLYQESSVFVFPSLSEGSAKVTYEAMACGVPVIVTPNAGSVARDGLDGYVVPLNDREALMEKILHLYEHPEKRRDMGASARKHMESFTWERHRRDLIALYERAFRGEPLEPDAPLRPPGPSEAISR